MARFGTGGRIRCGVTAAAALTASLAVSVAGGTPVAASGAGTTSRASVSSSGSEADKASLKPTLSADGRYVAFTSSATSLVPGDTNNEDDVFVHDRQAGTTTRVSVSSGGAQAVSRSGARWTQDQAISPDGRYVAFVSTADNLVPGDTVSTPDLFVHDRVTATTTRASRLDLTDRAASPVFSGDGRYLAFTSDADDLVQGDTNDRRDVFVHDTQTGVTTRVSVPNPSAFPPPVGATEANDNSASPSISADGRYVAFHSTATNLLGTAGDTNDRADVFVHDRTAGTTSRVSVASDGSQADNASQNAAISADGNLVAFRTLASNLVPSDTNTSEDVVVHNRTDGTTSRVSVASGGVQASGASDNPSISADGGTVAFRSTAPDLVGGDTNGQPDIFQHHRATGTTARVSVASDGTQATGSSLRTSISGDGRYVAFDSLAPNLVPVDTNAVQDVFVHDTAGATVPPALSVADASVEEGDTGTRQMTFTVSLDRPADSAVTATFSTADGTAVAPGDYEASSGTLSLAPGAVTASVEVTVNGDTTPEGDETLSLTIADAAGATIARATAVGTIVDDEPVLAIGDVKVYEGDAATRVAVFTVSLSRPAPTVVGVTYATSNGTAVKRSDYTRTFGTLELPAGATTAKVKVPVLGDTADEGNETFNVLLTNPQGVDVVDAVGTGTVVDDDPPSLSGRQMAIGDVVVHEGHGGTRVAVFTVSLSTAAGSVITVNYATSNSTAAAPGDYEARSGTLSFAAGTTSATIKVTVHGDEDPESDERFTVGLSEPSGPAFIADASGLGTILDDD